MYTQYNKSTLSDEAHFEEGLVVSVKRQSVVLRVVQVPSPPLSELDSVNDDFKPGRVVANFVVVRGDSPMVAVSRFAQPIEVRINYTEEDVARLNKAIAAYQAQQDPQGPPPRATVGYWDKTHWVLFNADQHSLQWEPAEPGIDNPTVTEAVAIVKLNVWPDPPIGSGPP